MKQRHLILLTIPTLHAKPPSATSSNTIFVTHQLTMQLDPPQFC